ncbi:FecR family protein [Sphingomonas laterariae]|uniref:FecR family protein n=1 Tax=Edaphosphingomonas laterariae TaxID=861865 RepID=A0A239HY40_9SPHN|nr:FecR family protein [Sphingomonas laterariae]SNS86376.1 FecR family protein [Sphingomonas laterariae]
MAEMPPPGRNATTSARAAHWVARMGSEQTTDADHSALASWLLRDQTHNQAYSEQTALWNAVGALADDPVARALLQRSEPEHAPAPRFARRSWLYGLAGAAAAALVAVTAVPLMTSDGEQYATAMGEQRSITLSDGSVITLDTDSAIDVELSRNERRLTLRSGQAFFDVARDAKRPFRVFAGDSEVRALGTSFSVRRDGARTQVFLARGSVAVRDAGHAAVKLEAGEQAELAPATTAKIGKVDPERAQAWRFGRLMFDATPLATAVAEINRYGGRQIVLSDPALAQVRISGVFHTRQPEAFAETVAAVFPVRRAPSSTDVIVLAPTS